VHEDLIVEVLSEHSESLLRTARANSCSIEDAQDAYQRALEKFIVRAGRLTRDGAPGWLHVVVRNEAHAVRASRPNLAPTPNAELDRISAATVSTPEELALLAERTARAAEALSGLKADERRAIGLKAIGHSYEEIASHTGWTRTKVNRSLVEGRARLAAKMTGIEAGLECERWAPHLSAVIDGEAPVELLLELRPHLRHCAACRATLRQMAERESAVRLVFPAGLVVSVERTTTLVGQVLPGAAPEAVIGAGGIGSLAAIATKSAAVLAVTAASVAIPGTALPERDAEARPAPAASGRPTAAVLRRELGRPAASRPAIVRRPARSSAADPAASTSTAAERRDAAAAKEWIPPRAPEPAVQQRTPQADEFTP